MQAIKIYESNLDNEPLHIANTESHLFFLLYPSTIIYSIAISNITGTMRPQQPISFSSTAVIFLSLLSVASRVNSQDSFGQADVRSFGGAGSQGSEDSLGSVGGAPPPPHQNPFARRPSNINNDGSDSRHQNPFGNRPANANNGDPNSGDQNPIGQNSGGNNNGDSGPGNQNSFNQNSGNTNTGASNPAGNQNSGNAGTGNSNSGGSQNPAGQNFGNNGNDNSNSGSQNPLGQNSGNVNPSGPNSGTQNPSGGGFGPLVNGVGCPNARVAAPASTDRLVYANSPVCPSGKVKSCILEAVANVDRRGTIVPIPGWRDILHSMLLPFTTHTYAYICCCRL